MKTVVYLDVLLAVNWIIDYFLLLAAAGITGTRTNRWRLLGASALGSVSTLIFLAPPLPFGLQLLYQAATESLVVLAAFPHCRRRGYWKSWLWYLLLNFCYAGIVLAAMYYLSVSGVENRNLAFYYNVSPVLLCGCILGMYLLLRLLLFLFERPRSQAAVWAHVEWKEETIDAEILLDSGFTGRDMIVGQPLLLLSRIDCLTQRQPQLKAMIDSYYGNGRLAPEALRLLPLHTAAGDTLVPALSADVAVNSRRARLTVGFANERFQNGKIQGLFGEKSYEMMGDEKKNGHSEKNSALAAGQKREL